MSRLFPEDTMDTKNRTAIADRLFADETALVQRLASEVQLSDVQRADVERLARTLVANVRANRRSQGSIDSFMQQFSLSSEEGVVLMCLAESLLRIPDCRHRRQADCRQDRREGLGGASRPV
jgi:RHH-type proline utilization regulon transcriptional repressor/proline dehydrogenase/delta 1-pyrroline-5-carboxylate dehydrogenase